jgi:hypothetical protein
MTDNHSPGMLGATIAQQMYPHQASDMPEIGNVSSIASSLRKY